ncbi:unnamed protein product [Didymodactylos carnosus]|uniref:Uncharacterized protein n=1 Tax=Didymodactylos carnosus TaxID=1234261 RepID=A0A816FLQ3_9BILA|nr:unnamed protein product [Didymodactylos carnosus]CAF4616412.1 unnamed protein product [Didymodactylos carnosus]
MTFTSDKLAKAFNCKGKVQVEQLCNNWSFNKTIRINRPITEFGLLDAIKPLSLNEPAADDVPSTLNLDEQGKQKDDSDHSFLDDMNSDELDELERSCMEIYTLHKNVESVIEEVVNDVDATNDIVNESD